MQTNLEGKPIRQQESDPTMPSLDSSSHQGSISAFHSHAAATTADESAPPSAAKKVRQVFLRLLQPCEADPKAAVDKAWTIAIIIKVFMVIAAVSVSK